MDDPTFSPTIIPVWTEDAPGSEQWSQQEQETYLPLPPDVPQTYLPLPFNVKIVRNIAQPTLTAYLPAPAIATGTAVVICPGGVFHYLSTELEGTAVAHWLCARGIAAFVLKYRVLQTEAHDENLIKQLQERFSNLIYLMELMQQIEPLAIADGRQALKVVRHHAIEWGIAPERIGILGFSSGGGVAIGASMQYDEASRPDLAASIYPAFSGRDIVVPADAPPLFLLAANDDPMGAGTSQSLYSAWRDASRPVELHIYAQGGHGFGMTRQGLPTDHWMERFHEWLQSQGTPA